MIEWDIKITDRTMVAGVVLVIVGFFFYFMMWISTYGHSSMIFEDMDEARRYQRECLSQGNSARVREHVTGIEIICEGRDRP